MTQIPAPTSADVIPPAPPAQAPATPSPSWLEKIKLTEPVRLYLWTVAIIAAVGLQLAGVTTGDWLQYEVTAAAVVLGVGGVGEAIRQAVWPAAGIVRELTAALGQQPAQS
jgi:hypothetical protein